MGVDHYISPSKIGLNEKAIIEESIFLSIKICLKLLLKHSHLIKVVGKIFDPKLPFYFGKLVSSLNNSFRIYYANLPLGTKIGFTFTPGHPAVRITAIRKFLEGKGFIILSQTLKSADCCWPGTDVLVNILNTINSPEVILRKISLM